MQTPIETAFADFCAKHDSFTFELGINLKQSERCLWHCTIHHDGPTRFNGCVIANGPTPEQAISNALAELHADRSPDMSEVPDLTLNVAESDKPCGCGYGEAGVYIHMPDCSAMSEAA